MGSRRWAAGTAIDRLRADYERGRVPLEIAGPKLKEMQAKKAALERRGGVSDQSRPIRSRTTTMIRMTPMRPIPPLPKP